MQAERQLPLPLPLDAHQHQLLRGLVEGPLVCSEGTPRHDAALILQDRGLVVGHFCPAAAGVWQFELSQEGARALGP